MKILKFVALSAGVLIAALLLILLFRSPKIHMERSIVINAPAEKIFPYLNSARMFHSWSPFSKIDTTAAYSFEGPDKGVGSKMAWIGNKDMGKGAQWIVESGLNKMVKNGLAFQGKEGVYSATFTLLPEGNGTAVTWTFDCDASNVSSFGEKTGIKFFGLFTGSMLGPTYDKGLQTLKGKVEGTSPAAPLKQPLP